MHEMSIAESIIDIIRETLNDDDHRKLLSVTVEIGELTAVIPESLHFCFQALVEETPYKGAELIIKNIPLKGKCVKCESEFSIKNYAFICPSCGSSEVQVMGGQELKVTELEVE